MNTALSRMRLETERLIIRPYVESDLMESFELMQDPELFTYLHFGVMSLESYQKLFSWLIKSYQTPFDAPFKYSLAIFKKETGAFIGWCGVGVLDFMAPEKELYYLIGRNDWGKGYATEAARALTAYSFEVIGLDRMYAKADPRNKGSLKIFEKLGFTFERELQGLSGDDEDCNGELLYVLAKEQFQK
ncbi:GNAT family N-acetyltransferase [Brevibacillus nitrificans]|uniref:GNAT family N-acetyltransferase n=1 Tax=Brevibacillus nitrificans TaxID=651560 RepID=UPI00285D752A|nr:GNAT family N-acetyltransferase [Brevibacillus nitrificans]MDR7314875.1 ribosomal-protein-alanine N-acetyltransferase [Brevibacillus nitrificans]